MRRFLIVSLPVFLMQAPLAYGETPQTEIMAGYTGGVPPIPKPWGAYLPWTAAWDKWLSAEQERTEQIKEQWATDQKELLNAPKKTPREKAMDNLRDAREREKENRKTTQERQRIALEVVKEVRYQLPLPKKLEEVTDDVIIAGTGILSPITFVSQGVRSVATLLNLAARIGDSDLPGWTKLTQLLWILPPVGMAQKLYDGVQAGEPFWKSVLGTLFYSPVREWQQKIQGFKQKEQEEEEKQRRLKLEQLLELSATKTGMKAIENARALQKKQEELKLLMSAPNLGELLTRTKATDERAKLRGPLNGRVA